MSPAAASRIDKNGFWDFGPAARSLNLRQWEQSAGVECYLTVDRAAEGWQGNVGVVGSLFKKPGVQVIAAEAAASAKSGAFSRMRCQTSSWRTVRSTRASAGGGPVPR